MVAAGLIGGRSNYARGCARRLAGPDASAKTGALGRGVQRPGGRTALVPDAGPRRSNAKGRRAAGAVARDSVVCRRRRNPCDRRVEQFAVRYCAQTAAKQAAKLARKIVISRLTLSRRARVAKPARLRRVVSPRAPQAVHQLVRLRALTAKAARRDARRDRSPLQNSGDGQPTPRTKLHIRQHDAQAPRAPPQSEFRTVQAGHGAQPHGPGAR